MSAPCLGCGAVIDCGQFGGVVSDVAPSSGIFATQGYSFIQTCPRGYYCIPGLFPRVISIGQGSIPPVIVNPNSNVLRLQGCQSVITRTIPLGATYVQIAIIAAQMQQAWAAQQAACNNLTQFPQPIRIPTGGGRLDMANTQQCFTAHCVPDTAGTPVTRCTPAGTFTEVLLNPTPALIGSFQASLDALAFNQAEDDANAALQCGVCNAFLHGFETCPGNPGLAASYSVQAGTFCQPIGTPQAYVDALASCDLVQHLQVLMTGLGCACTFTADNATKNITTTCPIGFLPLSSTGNLLPAPLNTGFTVNGTTNWTTLVQASYGITPPPGSWNIFIPGVIGPQFKFYYT